MKIKYTPGTSDGLVGKTFKVEIIDMTLITAKHIDAPLLKSVRIRYENGTEMEISGNKLIDSIDMIQKSVHIISQ